MNLLSVFLLAFLSSAAAGLLQCKFRRCGTVCQPETCASKAPLATERMIHKHGSVRRSLTAIRCKLIVFRTVVPCLTPIYLPGLSKGWPNVGTRPASRGRLAIGQATPAAGANSANRLWKQSPSQHQASCSTISSTCSWQAPQATPRP